MESLAKIFSPMIFIFGLVFIFSACNQSQDKDKKMEMSTENLELAGVWIVTDSTGNKFDITLNKDGTATSTWSTLDKGKWKVINQKKAHIQWNNGANEFIIIDERGGAERQTFAPGKSIEGKPSEVTKIKKK
jgi:uncharacterized lipoprotein NlpE involved in copper resistance